MENITNIIAKNIEKIRKEKGYSFAQLAQLTGVGKSMLAQIEKGQKTPTVTTLWKIGSGLNVSPSTLMAEEQHLTAKVIKSENPNQLIEDEGKYVISTFLPFDNETKFEVYKMEFKPGCIHMSEPHFKEVREYVFVYNGDLEIEIKDNVYKASSGEAIVFTGDVPHIYRNVSNETVFTFNLIFDPNR